MKKTILKYLVECILIFISVICAFLVENVRDRNQEKEQELDLLRDVTSDLVLDTALIKQRVEFGRYLDKELTKIISTLEHPNKKDTIDDYSLKYSTGLFLNKTTYEGIKNTSGFKFIKDKNLVSALSNYYNNREEWTRFFSLEMDKTQSKIEEYLGTETKFVDYSPISDIPVISYNVAPESLTKMKGDQRIINLCYEKRARVQQMTYLMDSLKRASGDLNLKCEKYLNAEN